MTVYTNYSVEIEPLFTIATMPTIHLIGSSHVGANHELPTIFAQKYGSMREGFKNKFTFGTAMGASGGRIGNIDLVNEFVSVAEETAQHPRFDGQVVCLLLGTNDWALPDVYRKHVPQQLQKLGG